jgi:hypothetical protein
VSAFLLFQVQPVIAKIILPWFGGSAAVWTTCLLFFQLVLLLGYLYAHAVIRYLKPRAQMLVHGALLLVSAVGLPIYPKESWKPTGTEDPMLAILTLLAMTVGLPYFLLSTTGPLLQAWYARRFQGAMPYRLYALSNLGSMFALISYPILFEPVFGTHRQAIVWSAAYGVFMLICGLSAFRSGTTSAAVEEKDQSVERPRAKQIALWIALPACASVLLLAITNHLSQNVAAIPFLWVLPLSIYLLTFILCFEGSGWYKRSPYLQLLAVALLSMAQAQNVDYSGSVPIKIMLPLFGIGLFTCCMVCHGELARMKPHPRYLTHFYLMISAGGAVGGLLVGLVAPYVFKALYELQIGMAACAVLTLIVLSGDDEYAWFKGLLAWDQLLAGAAVLGIIGFETHVMRGRLEMKAKKLIQMVRPGFESPDEFNLYILGVVVLGGALLTVVLLRMGRVRGRLTAILAEVLALGLVGYLAYNSRQLTADYRLTVRNFYGALKVRDSGPETDFFATRTLTHGTINHGEQYLNPARKRMAVTYYGPSTGIGVAMTEKLKSGAALRVGVIGLGTGTMAAYGRQGDYYRFYEINPLVPGIARTQFSYLNDSPAKIEIAMGDARLSLEREEPENFDVLAVDAFSSDSIPVHLLTKEAMLLFYRHLKKDGILAVHISNRYLDLQPVLAGHMRETGWLARVVDNDDDSENGVFGATWVLFASPVTHFPESIMSHSSELGSKRTVRLWTDDYSNLYQILK